MLPQDVPLIWKMYFWSGKLCIFSYQASLKKMLYLYTLILLLFIGSFLSLSRIKRSLYVSLSMMARRSIWSPNHQRHKKSWQLTKYLFLLLLHDSKIMGSWILFFSPWGRKRGEGGAYKLIYISSKVSYFFSIQHRHAHRHISVSWTLDSKWQSRVEFTLY